MPTQAKVIKDSITLDGHRLTTMEVTFHRFVLAEFNTHRVFSRNSASSRAIPVEKQLERVKNDPAWPLVWAGEQPGMQGSDELDPYFQDVGRQLFKFAHDKVIREVEAYLKIVPDKAARIHKSLINRLLEPFMWHTVIVSSTEWDNFFTQRCSPLAQPEIRVAAEMMREALNNSTPTEMPNTSMFGRWHLPYMDEKDIHDCIRDAYDPRQVSVARCARVSYMTHDGIRDVGEDVILFSKLMEASPPHWSPLEHVATPAKFPYDEDSAFTGNFQGWFQFRHWRQW